MNVVLSKSNATSCEFSPRLKINKALLAPGLVNAMYVSGSGSGLDCYLRGCFPLLVLLVAVCISHLSAIPRDRHEEKREREGSRVRYEEKAAIRLGLSSFYSSSLGPAQRLRLRRRRPRARIAMLSVAAGVGRRRRRRRKKAGCKRGQKATTE